MQNKQDQFEEEEDEECSETAKGGDVEMTSISPAASMGPLAHRIPTITALGRIIRRAHRYG